MTTQNNYTLPDDMLKYLMKIYSYRVKFYALSDNVNEDILWKYEIFTEDAEFVSFLHGMQMGKNTETISITIDYNEPLPTVQNQIKDFTDNLLNSVKSKYIENQSSNSAIYDYHRKKAKYLPYEAFILKDVLRNSKEGKKFIDFDSWDKYLKVYTLHKKENFTNKQIVFAMDFIDESGGTFTDNAQNTAYNKVATYISRAIKMIESAEKGIFPYITD